MSTARPGQVALQAARKARRADSDEEAAQLLTEALRARWEAGYYVGLEHGLEQSSRLDT